MPIRSVRATRTSIKILTTLTLANVGIAAAEEPVLEEVTVTAQKREESIQRVPIAITAFDPDRLQSLGIENTSKLAFAVPGLTIDNIVGYSQLFIRGVGNDLTQGVDSSVALHIDGVYVPQLTQQLQELVGLERVEVLRGPQGTLYGRNATGGAINIITKSPDFADSTATVSAGVANYSGARGSLYASSPFSDSLAGNIALSYKRHDAFNENLSSLGGDLPKAEDVVARGKLRFKSSERFEALLSATYSTRDDPDAMFSQQIQPNSVGAFVGGLVGSGGQQTSRPHDSYLDSTPFSKTKFQLYSLRMNADLGAANLVSITGYQRSKLSNLIDFDATDAFVFNFKVHSKQSAFSQEVQLLSKPESRIRWIGGLYYLDNDFRFNPVTIDVAPVPTLIESHDTTKAYAAFGEVTVPLTDQWSITGGLRYTREKKAIPQALIVGVADFGGDDKTWSKTTPKVTLTYQATEETMVWATAGRGFKSGGFNASSPTALGPLDPETIDAVEAGIKTTMAGRVRVNASAFHYKVDNLQVQIVDTTGGAGAIAQNAAAAKMWGGELEFDAQATDALRFNLNAAYLHARYKDFENAASYIDNLPFPGNSSFQRDASGLETQRSPEWTVSASGEYVVPLASSSQLAFSTLYAYKDSYSFDPLGRTRQPGYGIWNAAIGYTAPGGHFRASLWGENLTDKNYFAIANENVLGTFVTYAAPRTYGLTLTYDFL